MRMNCEQSAEKALRIIEASLEKMGFEYEKDDSGKKCHLIVQGNDIPMPITLWTVPEYYLVMIDSVLPFFVAVEKLEETAIALNEINSRIVNGVFYLDRENRVIHFKMADSYLGGPIGEEAIRLNIRLLIETVDKHNDKLAALNRGELDKGYFIACV